MTINITEDIHEDIANGVIDYETYNHLANVSIQFKGKSFNEWNLMLAIQDVNTINTLEDLEAFNSQLLNAINTLSDNHCYSKASLDIAELHYDKAMSSAKKTLSDSRAEEGGRSYSREVIESLAKNLSKNQYTAWKISEMMHNYWQTRFNCFKMIDSRLTSMNILKNIESRVSNG